MEGSKAGGEAKAAAGGTQPPAAAAGNKQQQEGEEEEEVDDEDASAAMTEAFERLIGASFEMVEQGKPMEAEYVLLEGAKQAEEILGKNALEVAALYDQLCIIRFLHERMEEAAQAAQRALEILKEHDTGFGPATAIAATRYAATLLATGNPQEAQLYTARSIDGLHKALQMLAEIEGDGEEEKEELAETKAKFEIGLGESKFYHGLAKQAQNLAPEAVGPQLKEMKEGLELMQQHLGPDSPLIGGALREHSRLIISALEGDELELAEALYGQDVQLHMVLNSNFDHIALTLYQCGTLQYVMGKYEQAAETLRMSLETVKVHFPDAEEHLLTVQQRLGMVLALVGQYERGKEMLHEVAPALRASLGEGNPVNEELEFTLSYISLKEMEQDGVTDPSRRLEGLAAMQKHLKALSGYGEEHMLVKKAAQLYDEAASTVQNT